MVPAHASVTCTMDYRVVEALWNKAPLKVTVLSQHTDSPIVDVRSARVKLFENAAQTCRCIPAKDRYWLETDSE